MADVTVNGTVNSAPQFKAVRSQVFTTASIGYQFLVNGLNDDLIYQKTTDGGATWGSAVTVRTGTVNGFDIWFDKWTPGDSGTVIHIWYIDTTAKDLFYRSLDTSGDSLGTERTVLNSTVSGEELVSGAKARDGNLVVIYNLDGSTSGGYDSADGVTWSAIASPHEGVPDYFMLFPGNAADERDMWLAFWDRSANEISLKTYDDSGDSWSEDSISTGMTATAAVSVGSGWSGSIRLSDNHLILVAANGRDTAGPVDDLKVWDINGGASITALTNVITNQDDWYNPTIFIDQNNSDLYVGYNGKADGSETLGTSTTINYKKSTDDGSTWGSEVAYSQSSGAFLALSGSLGGTETRFEPSFWKFDDLFVNFVNSVEIGVDPINVTPNPVVVGVSVVAPSITLALTVGPVVTNVVVVAPDQATGIVPNPVVVNVSVVTPAISLSSTPTPTVVEVSVVQPNILGPLNEVWVETWEIQYASA